MGSKKDIGKAYKDQLESYNASPNNRVWENIEAELKKSNREAFPIWKTITGIGILILLTSSLIIYNFNNNIDSKTFKNNSVTKENCSESKLNNSNSKNNSTIGITIDGVTNSSTDNDSSNTENSKNNLYNTDSNNKTSNYSRVSQSNKNKFVSNNDTNKSSKHRVSSQPKAESNTKPLNKSHLKDNLADLDDSSQIQNSPNDSINIQEYPDAIIKFEFDKEKKKTNKKNIPLAISGYVAPTYFSSLSKGSSIDEDLSKNKRIGGFHVNYGISITIELSKKSSLRLGIANLDLSYTTKNADSTGSNGFLINSPSFSNIDLDFPVINRAPIVFGTIATLDLKQELNYLEFPIEYSYRFLENKKLKLNLNSGFSILSLSSQNIIVEDDNGNSLKIGKANNLKEMSFSFNVSSGLSYSISKKINLFTEPIFKYHIQTFNKKTDFKPFNIGVRFGLTYKFQYKL